jgi:Bacterial protein of unknown function (DUF885)
MFPRPSRPRFLRRPLPALLVLVAALVPALAFAQAPASTPPPHAPPAWVARSNANAQVLLRILARFAPEQAASYGVTGLDGEIFDLSPGFDTRAEKATSLAVDTLKARLATEKDPAVKQDLSILISSAEDNNEGSRLGRKLQLPYLNVSQVVFQGLRALLDDQVPAERRAFALKRLNRYAGLEPGTQPLTVLAMARTRERLADKSLMGPFKGQVERDLAQGPTFVAGIEEMFKKYNVTGYEKGLAALKEQFATYDAFVRSDIMPRATADFRQPAELYAFNLRQVGVDMSVAELTSRATVSFKEIQNQMQALAPRVAKEKGITATDYRDVIAALKKQQLVGDAILPHYRQRVKDIETIIRRENIVTLPDREMRIELSSAADAAQQPAPHMQPPQLIGNTGQMGTFVLPLHVPSTDGKTLDTDDFTFEAASWTLTAHEGRPGHELQFAGMVENGVSIARALFAFNSVNVEGWGLYAEAEMQPYEPLEGQLIALQHRLMRSARAFLDPGLQAGTITKEEATRVLRRDVCLSEAMTLQEVQRYTFRAPGQATSYFVGYNRILEIRAEAERKLGDRFDRKKFNDFVISQGLIPPPLLRKAVMEEFVPSLKSAS